MKWLRAITPVLFGVILLGADVFAQTVIPWIGNPGTSYNTATNWLGNAVPTSAQIASFGGGGGPVTVTTAATVGGLQFPSTATGPYTLGSSTSPALTVGSYGVASLAASNQQISNPLVFTAANTSISNTGQGTLTIGSNASAVTLNTGASLVFGGTVPTGGTTGVVQGIIGGSGGVTFNGGNWTLWQQNTYTGGTTISQGKVTLNSNAGLPSGGNLAITAAAGQTATLDIAIGAGTQTLGSILLGGADSTATPKISLASGTVTLAGDVTYSSANKAGAGLITGPSFGPTLSLSGARSFIVGDSVAAVDLLIDAKLDGSGSLVKEGPGTLALANTGNSFTGGTTVKQGVLSLTGTGAVMSGSSVTVNATSGNAELQLNGTSQQFGQLTLGGSTVPGLSNVVDLGTGNYGGGYLTIGGNTNGTISYVASNSAATDQAMATIKTGTLSMGNGGTISVANSALAAVDLYVSSAFAGTGTVTKTGGGTLMLDGTSSGLTADLVASAGTLMLGSSFASTTSGTGKIDVQSGAVLAGGWFFPQTTSASYVTSLSDITVQRQLSLRNSSQLGVWTMDQGKLVLNAPVTVDPLTTVSVAGAGGIQVAGGIDAASPGAVLAFANANSQRRSVVGITSGVGSNISTLSSAGAAVIFTTVPTATNLLANSGGYIGIAPPSGGVGSAPSVASVLAQMAALKANYAGTFGFDSPKNGTLTTYSDSLIDFTGFNQAMTIGSVTRAVLSSASVIKPAGPSYAFGNGGGILAVASSLTDDAVTPTVRSLSVSSSSSIKDNSLGVILQGTNTFSGNVTVDNSYLLFDSANAFPAKSGQQLLLTSTGNVGAYLGATEISNLANFRRISSLLGQYSPSSVIGFDSHAFIANQMLGSSPSISDNRLVVEGLNLSALSPLYLGTATAATLAGTVVAPAAGVSTGNHTLYLAAVGDGRLTVKSLLSSPAVDKLVLGGSSTLGLDGTVVINGRNTFTGGTTLFSGSLELASGTRTNGGTLLSGPLGTGSLLVPAAADKPSLRALATASTNSLLPLANNLALESRLVVGDGNSLAYSYNPSGTLLALAGTISGPGGLDVYTSTALSGTNTFSGGVQLYNGVLTLGSNGALGSGDLTLNVPSMAYEYGLAVDGNREISNNVYIQQASANSSGIGVSGKGTLNLKGTVTLQTPTVFSPQSYPLTLSGTVNGYGSLTNNGYAAMILSGTNSYQGGTVSNLGSIVFGSLAAIPASPAAGLVSNGYGYIGLASTNFGTGTYQTAFVDRFDKSVTSGSLGFDSLPDSQGALTVNTFNGPVDLTGFTSNVRLGSATQAILSGEIKPQGTTYRFGGGGGVLTVSSALTDISGTNLTARSLNVVSPYYAPLTLRVSGTGNTFTGGATVDSSAVIFSSATGALPATGTFNVSNFGYFGTENATLYNSSLSSYLGRFYVSSGGAVVGFDVAGSGTPTAVAGTINLGAITVDPALVTLNKDPAIFLGTATKAEIGNTATITLPANQTSYRFTGYKGGELTVSAPLSGAYGVQIGDKYNPASFFDPSNPAGPLSTVILKGYNTYTGDTVLQAGQLVVGGNNALGNSAGKLHVSTQNYSSLGSLPRNPVLSATVGSWTVPNGISLDNTSLTLAGSNPFTLSGVIESNYSGGLFKTGSSVVTLSGFNTFTGGTTIEQGTMIFAGQQAAGSGPLTLTGSGSPIAQFTQAYSTVSGIGGSATGGVIQLAPSSTLAVFQYTDADYAGAFSGSGADLRFQGLGYGSPTLTLSGSSGAFTGTTSIYGGVKLQIANAGALGSSSVTINGGKLFLDRDVRFSNPVVFDAANGGSLGGNGELVRATTLTVGAHAGLDPGSDLPGVLSFSGSQGLTGPVLSLASGGTLKIKMSDALDTLGGWDRINVAGLTAFDVPTGLFTVKLSFTGGTNLAAFANFDATQTYAWPILAATSITGFSPNSVFVDLGGITLPTGASFFTSLNLAGDTVLLNYSPVAVPEPSTWALILSGAAFLGFKLRRRRF